MEGDLAFETKSRDLSNARVSVIVCTYSLERETLLRDTIRSLQTQERAPDELVVVVDHNPKLYRILCRDLHGVTVIESASHVRGIAGSRTTGLNVASGSIIAFVDDDATARPGWLANLLPHFSDPAVMVAGSHVAPRWESKAPPWFPDEFGWVLGCSYPGQLASEDAGVVRNVYANGMAVRRRALEAGAFQTNLGRVGSVPLGCEETEWCIRVSRHFPSSKIVQVPSAVLDHFVPTARTSFRRFIRHCFAEGLSKAAVASLVGSNSALASERRYVSTTLRSGVLRRLVRAAHHDNAELRQAAAICVGLASTLLGYALGRTRGAVSGPAAPPPTDLEAVHLDRADAPGPRSSSSVPTLRILQSASSIEPPDVEFGVTRRTTT